jgi:cytochrome c-type biogenesis protein CcmH/NrfF
MATWLVPILLLAVIAILVLAMAGRRKEARTPDEIAADNLRK